jgi:hypothetical protein
MTKPPIYVPLVATNPKLGDKDPGFSFPELPLEGSGEK